MKALYFDEFGSSDVMHYGNLPDPVPAVGETLVRVSYAGLNFADIYRRRGKYHLADNPPHVNGYEASGTTETGALAGCPVLFVDAPRANAELVAVPEHKLIPLPADLDTKIAATIGLQGLTADFLAHDLGRNQPGDTVFVTGVTGGVGQLLAQILMADGVIVCGSASTSEKARTAVDLGVCEVFPSRERSWIGTQESRFDTVYDGLGATLNDSLALLKNRGSVVLFGFAAGDPPPVDFSTMIGHSKNILTGDLWDFLTTQQERKRRFDRLTDYLRSGRIRIASPTVFPLSEGKSAHDMLESGSSTGKILLKP